MIIKLTAIFRTCKILLCCIPAFLLSCRSIDEKKDYDEVVATINGEPVSSVAIDKLIQNQLYESLFGIYYKRRIAAEEYLASQVLVLEARSKKIPKDSLVSISIDSIKQHYTQRQYIEDKNLTKGIIDPQNPTRLVSLDSDEGMLLVDKAYHQTLYENYIVSLFKKYHASVVITPPMPPAISLKHVEGHSLNDAGEKIKFWIFADSKCDRCRKFKPTLDSLILSYDESVEFIYASLAPEVSGSILALECTASSTPSEFKATLDEFYTVDTSSRVPAIKCANEQEVKDRIAGNMNNIYKLGISITPTIAIDNRVYHGDYSYQNISRYIDLLLKKNDGIH